MNQSMMYFNSSNPELVIPVYLYSILIPIMKEIYKEISKEFVDKDKKHFSVKIGLEVIKSIMDNNNIELSDIDSLYLKSEEYPLAGI